MRLSVIFAGFAVATVFACGAAAAQETEAPSSKPSPSPGAPPPPLALRGDASSQSGRPDGDAAQAAVRAQCVADRARFCRRARDADACLSAHFHALGVDCQTAVNAVQQAHTEREVVAPR